jgi:copper chaperone CopZ
METLKNIKNATFQLETLTCPTCITKIEGVLLKNPGVENAKVLFNSSKVKVEYDEEKVSADSITKLIEKLGYPVMSSNIKK